MVTDTYVNAMVMSMGRKLVMVATLTTIRAVMSVLVSIGRATPEEYAATIPVQLRKYRIGHTQPVLDNKTSTFGLTYRALAKEQVGVEFTWRLLAYAVVAYEIQVYCMHPAHTALFPCLPITSVSADRCAVTRRAAPRDQRIHRQECGEPASLRGRGGNQGV